VGLDPPTFFLVLVKDRKEAEQLSYSLIRCPPSNNVVDLSNSTVIPLARQYDSERHIVVT